VNGKLVFLLAGVIVLCSGDSWAQEVNAWGETFDCAVDFFGPCLPKKSEKKETLDEMKQKRTEGEKSAALSLVGGPNPAGLPGPVRKVLENPSPETAREYVAWMREGNERLGRASEYIAQAEREMGPAQGFVGEKIQKKQEIESRGLVGLYYFFSLEDPSTREDVKVLNKVFREEQVGVVGIPVKGRSEDLMRFIKLSNPLFPVRKGEEEVKLIGPKRTPDLYLALPLQKKIFRVGSNISEAAIKEALEKAVAEVVKERLGSGSPPLPTR